MERKWAETGDVRYQRLVEATVREGERIQEQEGQPERGERDGSRKRTATAAEEAEVKRPMREGYQGEVAG